MKKGVLLALLLAADSVIAQVPFDRLLDAANDGDNWLTYAGDYKAQRHSPLKQITRENVGSLVPKWVHHIDTEGKLRLANAGSLRQTLEYQMDLEAAIRRVASGRTLGTYGSMPRYFPVEELVGKKCPDFEAPLVDGGDVKTWYQMIDPNKINVLFFWAVDCGHCRASLPGVNDWLRSQPEGINFVGVPNVPNEALKIQTTEYCRNQEFAFPNLMDETREIADLYKIVSTPTYLVIRGDGVIDSVYTTGSGIDEALEAKRAELLTGASGS